MKSRKLTPKDGRDKKEGEGREGEEREGEEVKERRGEEWGGKGERKGRN